MIPNSRLARYRAIAEKSMVDRADIIHKARTTDESGGQQVTKTTQANVPCRRSPHLAGNVETLFGGQLSSGLQWKFSFPYDTVIDNDDEIIQGEERFAVMGTLGPRTFEVTRQVIAVEKGKVHA